MDQIIKHTHHHSLFECYTRAMNTIVTVNEMAIFIHTGGYCFIEKLPKQQIPGTFRPPRCNLKPKSPKGLLHCVKNGMSREHRVHIWRSSSRYKLILLMLGPYVHAS